MTSSTTDTDSPTEADDLCNGDCLILAFLTLALVMLTNSLEEN